MAYDPQREHRRPKPSDDGPTPIEAILDAESSAPPASERRAEPGGAQDTTPIEGADPAPADPVPDDPPPDPSVTPQPADPWSDQLLFGVSISTIVGAVVTALVFRWLWVRSRRSSSTGEGK